MFKLPSASTAFFPLAYLAGIVGVNWAFSYVGVVPIPGTEAVWPPLSLAVGVILILRDLAQRAIGHSIWTVMALGCAISYVMASPKIALASAAAFIVAEAVDWAVFTYTARTLRDRILLSSALSGPIDSAIFLLGIGFFGWVGFLAMTASKLLAAWVLWTVMRPTTRRAPGSGPARTWAAYAHLRFYRDREVASAPGGSLQAACSSRPRS